MAADLMRWRGHRHGGSITHIAWDYSLTLTSKCDDVDPELGMRPVTAAAQATLWKLDAAAITLALVSDTLADQDRRPALKAAAVDALFGDRVYLSHELCLAKAQPQFFEHVLEDLGIGADQLLVCGNNIDSDVRAPAALGIGAVLLGSVADRDLPPHATSITSIRDLPTLVTGGQITHA